MKKLLLSALLLAGLAIKSQSAHAQMSPATVAQGQVLSGTMRGYAERDRKAQLKGKRPVRKPLTDAQQRRAHQLEVEAAMRQPPAAPGTIR